MSVPVQEPCGTLRICVGRSTISTKLMISCKHEHLGEVMVVIDPFLLGCVGSNDCNVYLLAFKLSTLY